MNINQKLAVFGIKIKVRNMKNSLLTLIFSIFYFQQYAQSIPSYWMNYFKLENYFALRNDSVENIVVDVKGYYSSGESYSNKWTYYYSDKQTIDGTFFKNNVIDSRFKYKIDSSKRLIKSTIDFKSPLGGWYREDYEFEYNGEHRKLEKHYSGKDLIRYAAYVYDSIGFLSKIELTDAQRNLISFETAKYSDNRKSYIHEIFNKQGQLILKETLYCNIDDTLNKKNELGDWVQLCWITSNPDENVIYSIEYKYDKNSNWVEKKTYLSLKGKRKIQTIVKRKIKYKQ